MTQFEKLATEILGKVEVDNSGNYIGYTLALMEIAIDVLFDNAFYLCPEEELENAIALRFAEKFPDYRFRPNLPA